MVTLTRPMPERLAGLGVLGLAVAWSLGVALAHWDQIRAADLPLAGALLTIGAGSTLTVAGIWFGVGAVAWAMGRLLGGTAGFLRVLFAVSAASPPLWIAAPLLVAAPTGANTGLGLAAVGPIAALGFVFLLVSTLAAVQGFSRRRACGCAALTALFCASYLSLV